MCFGGNKKVELSLKTSESLESIPKKEVKLAGRKYSCEFSGRKVAGIVAAVIAAVMVITATIVASGVFGAGQMYFLAGGLAIGGMLSAAISAYLLHADGGHDRQLIKCFDCSLSDISRTRK